MKIVPFYIPKKFVPGLLNFRNSRLASDHISIAENLEMGDAAFLKANKDKLAKIARRNDCHLSFVRNDGFHSNSTKMDIGLPRVTFAEVRSHDDIFSSPVCYVTFQKEGDVVLPENLQKVNKPLEIIKQDIKTIKELFQKNKK